jgi:hypothetical protein
MSLLSSGLLARLRDVYSSSLQDSCTRLTPVATTGAYGYGKPTYAEFAVLTCLFRPSSKGGVIGGFGAGSNELLGSAQVETSDAVLFIPRDAVVLGTDRLQLTELQGETLTSPITYEIVGGPVLDQVEHRVTVRQVNDGS